MAKTLTLTWDNITPAPECGYKAFYRRKGDNQYSELTAADSASGTTTVTTQLAAPAQIEGYIVSDCCSGSTSAALPFGINSYVPFSAEVTNVNSRFTLDIKSAYGTTYDYLISGVYVNSDTGTVPFEVTYSSGSTELVTILAVATQGAVVTDTRVDAANAIFAYGGELQQFNSITTPGYVQLYWDGSSGNTWNGSPTDLPSFTIDAFNVTEVDGSDNTLQGNMLISWIYSSLYNNGEIPYNRVTFEVYDPANNLLGQTLIDTSIMGERNTSIVLTRVTPTYPLTGGTEFTMITKWDDETVIESKSFFLPV